MILHHKIYNADHLKQPILLFYFVTIRFLDKESVLIISYSIDIIMNNNF